MARTCSQQHVLWITLLLFSVISPVHANNNWFGSCTKQNTTLFQSGFDGVEVESLNNQSATLKAPKKAFACSQPWQSGYLSANGFNGGKLNFEEGTDTERNAKVIYSQARKSPVLQMTLTAPNEDTQKGRVQLDLSSIEGNKALSVSTKMFLGSGFDALKTYPEKMQWFVLSSWWNNAIGDNSPYPFVISIDLVNVTPGYLNFRARSRSYDASTHQWSLPIWIETNTEFSVPVGEWIQLEYKLIEGNALTGNFSLYATTQAGERHTIFNIQNYTHHPSDPTPDGFSDISPIKLYTYNSPVEYVAKQKNTLSIQWDDLMIIGCQQPGECLYFSPAKPPSGLEASATP